MYQKQMRDNEESLVKRVQRQRSNRNAPTAQNLNPKFIIQRFIANPNSLTHTDFMQLQSTIGNRAVVQMLNGAHKNNFDEVIQNKDNTTKMPNDLKAGIENLSGLSMDNVKVHYNSSKPAQVGALAYTQGTNIHVAPGQERHLPHEAWHVVQQAQGKVQPTMQMKGVALNDDAKLEMEADEMGKRAKNFQTSVQFKAVPERLFSQQQGAIHTTQLKPSNYMAVIMGIVRKLERAKNEEAKARIIEEHDKILKEMVQQVGLEQAINIVKITIIKVQQMGWRVKGIEDTLIAKITSHESPAMQEVEDTKGKSEGTQGVGVVLLTKSSEGKKEAFMRQCKRSGCKEIYVLDKTGKIISSPFIGKTVSPPIKISTIEDLLSSPEEDTVEDPFSAMEEVPLSPPKKALINRMVIIAEGSQGTPEIMPDKEPSGVAFGPRVRQKDEVDPFFTYLNTLHGIFSSLSGRMSKKINLRIQMCGSRTDKITENTSITLADAFTALLSSFGPSVKTSAPPTYSLMLYSGVGLFFDLTPEESEAIGFDGLHALSEWVNNKGKSGEIREFKEMDRLKRKIKRLKKIKKVRDKMDFILSLTSKDEDWRHPNITK